MQNLSIPDPMSEHRFEALRRYIERFRGKKFISYAILDMFELSKCLMGFENFLLAFYEEPTLVRNVLAMTTDWVIRVAQKAADIGADMIIDLSDIAWNNGTLVSREVVQEFFIPCLSRVVDAVKKRRAYVFYHTHGDISRVIDLIVNTGIDVLHPLDPDAGMDIGGVKQVYGSKIVVAGNISTHLSVYEDPRRNSATDKGDHRKDMERGWIHPHVFEFSSIVRESRQLSCDDRNSACSWHILIRSTMACSGPEKPLHIP